MTTERPRPILSDELKGATEKQEPAAQKSRLFSVDAIKAAFRAVAKAVITEFAPKPKRRRNRREETERAFGMVRSIIRRVRRPRHEPERLWLSDTLDWLQLWATFDETSPDLGPFRPGSFPGDDGFSPGL
jgi:hypothetical protein